MSQKILKSGAAVGIEASRAATSWETIEPVGLAYVGTTQMPLMLGSLAASSATASVSGPSSFIGTVTVSMPNQLEQREVPVVAGHRADEGDLLLLPQGRSLSTPPLSHRSVSTSRIITRLELPPATTCSGSTHSSSANISRSSPDALQPAVVADVDAGRVLDAVGQA